MILPPTTMGRPPSTGVAPRRPRIRSPAARHAVLKRLGGTAIDGGRHPLVDCNLHAPGLRVVQLLERDEEAVIVHYGNRHWPTVLARLSLSGGNRLLRLLEIDIRPV